MKSLSILLIILLSLFFFAENIEAKVLPQATKSTQKQTVVKTNGTGISVYPKLRADRRALIVNFANLQNATSVSYTLTYKQSLRSDDLRTAVQEEGAIGTLNLGGSSNASQELLFGTCSKNVCRYHTNISNARLEVSYTSKSGKKYVKRYRIKV